MRLLQQVQLEFTFFVQLDGQLGAEASASIAENYNTLQLTWDAAKDVTRDSEMRARIGGIKAQMTQFEFFFGVVLYRQLLHLHVMGKTL